MAVGGPMGGIEETEPELANVIPGRPKELNHKGTKTQRSGIGLMTDRGGA